MQAALSGRAACVQIRKSAVLLEELIFREQIFEVRLAQVSREAFFTQNVRNGLRLSLLQVEDFFFNGARCNQLVGIDRAGLADSMRTIYGLCFHRRIPPWIVKHHVARSGEVQAGSSGAEAQQEDGWIWIILERIHDILPLLRFTGEYVGSDLAFRAFRLKQFEHLHKLAEDKHLLTFGHQWLEEFEKRICFSGSCVIADQTGVTANLSKASECGENMHLALGKTVLAYGFHDLLATATEFCEVKFALFLIQRAIAALLNAVGQIFRDLFLQPAKEQGAELG